MVSKKVDKTGWKGWAKKMTNGNSIKLKWMEKAVKEEGGVAEMDDEDWDEVRLAFKIQFM